MVIIKKLTAIIMAVIILFPSVSFAYNIIDLPGTMPFDEAVGIFSADEITRATISNYSDSKYIELSREEINELYANMRSMSLERRVNPMPFRGTVLKLYTENGAKSFYVNSGVQLGMYGSSNYICYAPYTEADTTYITNIETIYRDAQEKFGGDEFQRYTGTDFLRLPSQVWAHTAIREAAANNLMPYEFTHKYDSNITREEFCKLIANLICVLTNYASLNDYMLDNGIDFSGNSFPDCAGRDNSILMLNAMGIVSGKDNGMFDPDGALSRVEAATLLTRTAERFMYLETGEDLYFVDANYIEPWAKYYVIWVNEQSIMNGSDGYFMPNDPYTVLQALITVNRLYKVMDRNLNDTL